MATISFILKGDSREAMDAFERLVASQKKVEQGADRVTAATRRAGQAATTGMNSAAASAAKFALGMVGVGSATAAIYKIAMQLKREYENLKSRQNEASQHQIGLAGARSYALMNKPGDMGTAWLDRTIESVSNQVGLGQGGKQKLWQGASGPLSAMGSLKPSQFREALTAGAQAHRRTGGQIDIGTWAAGTQDLMRNTGANAQQALGFLLTTGRQMRVTDPERQVQTLIPMLTAASTQGWSAEQAAELGAFVTTRSGDPKGRRSATSTAKFMSWLQEASVQGGAGAIPYRDKRGKTQYRALRSGGAAGLQELQDWYAGEGDKDLRKLGLARIEAGRAVSKGGFQALIAREPLAMAQYERAQQMIGSPTAPGAAAPWTQWLEEAGTGTGQQQIRAKGILGTLTDSMKERNPRAMAGALRDELAALSKAGGASDLTQRLLGAEFTLGGGAGKRDYLLAAIQRVQDLQKDKGFKYKYKWSNPIIGPSKRFETMADVAKDPYVSGDITVDQESGRDRYGRPKRFTTRIGGSTFGPHEDYNPELETKFNQAIAAMARLAQQIQAGQDKAINVNVITDKTKNTTPNANAQTE